MEPDHLPQAAIPSTERAGADDDWSRLNFIEPIDDVIWTFNYPEWSVQYVSMSVAQVYGRPAQAFHTAPRLWFKSAHPADRPQMMARFRELIKAGRQTCLFRIVRPDGEIRRIRCDAHFVPGPNPGRGVIHGISRDITEQYRLSESLRRSRRALRAVRDCETVIRGASDEGILLQKICDVMARAGYRMAWAGLVSKRGHGAIVPAGITGEHQGYLERVQDLLDAGSKGGGTVGEALRTRAPVVVNDFENDLRLGVWREEALRRGFFAKIALPLFHGHRAFGVLNVYAEEPDAFDTDEIELLDRLAQRVSVAIDALRERVARQAAERSLRLSEERFSKLYWHAPVALWEENWSEVKRAIAELQEHGVDDLLAYLLAQPAEVQRLAQLIRNVNANDEALRLAGARSPEDLSRRVNRHSAELGMQSFARQLAAVAAGQYVYEYEGTFARLDGALREQAVKLLVMPGHEHTWDFVIVAALDISGRKEAELALQEREAKFRSIAEAARDAIVVFGGEGRIVYWNAGAERIFGHPREDACERHISLVIPNMRQAARQYQIDHADPEQAGPDEGIHIETVGRCEDGREIPIELSVSSWDTQRGTFFSAIIRDVSERKRVEQELIAARDLANESARAKTEFIANISHEIRTPMNGILGMIELALATDLTSEQREYIDLARSSADGLVGIINDVLDLLKTESHKLVLERTPFDLGKSLREMLGPPALRARQKGVSLNIEIESRIPALLLGDPLRLRQVVMNLVNNAIKFTERGRIDIRVGLEQEAGDAIGLLFEVRDTGIGIPFEKQEVIFKPYVQSDSSITRKYGGTGLGLAICERLVKLMDGRIWVESQSGKGSAFFFSACFGRVIDGSKPSAQNLPGQKALFENWRRARVLLVEDNPVNQKFAMTVLRKAGHLARLAPDGRAALEAVAAEEFDVILMDVQMPEMDGFEAARRMRSSGVDTPIIAMTAHTMAGFDDKCAQVGMDDYLPKPVPAIQLLEAIESALTGVSRKRVFDAAASSGPAAGAGQVVSVDRALAMVSGDPRLLKTLAQMVLEQIGAELPLIRGHVLAETSGRLKEAAHRLKGSLGSMGAEPACQACAALEESARDGATGTYGERLAILEHELERLQPALRDLAV